MNYFRISEKVPKGAKISDSKLITLKKNYKNLLAVALKHYSRPGHCYPYQILSERPSVNLLFFLPEIYSKLDECPVGTFEVEFIKVLLSPLEYKTSINKSTLLGTCRGGKGFSFKDEFLVHFDKKMIIAIKNYVNEIEKHVTLSLNVPDRQFFINFFVEEITDFGLQKYDRLLDRLVDKESFKFVQLGLFLKLLNDVARSTSMSSSSLAKLKFLTKTSYSSQPNRVAQRNLPIGRTEKLGECFRIRSKKLFLTYSGVPCILPVDVKAVFLETLRNQLKSLSVDEAGPTKYLICLEKQSDGDNQLHVYLEYTQTLNCRKIELFEVDLSEYLPVVDVLEAKKKTLCKGNYVSAQNKEFVLNRIMKDRPGLDNILVNFELPMVKGVFY
jgi:hypothetical protein